MKIISLNAQAAYSFTSLMAFLEAHRADTDVFCFQEITSFEGTAPSQEGDGLRPDAFQQIARRLPGFHGLYAPVQDRIDWIEGFSGRASFGLATFVRPGLLLLDQADTFLCNSLNSYISGDYASLGYNALRVTVPHAGGGLTICGLHGISLPGDKLDSPARLEQSSRLLRFMSDRQGGAVIMGDFNLLPQTESVRRIENAGYRNLVREYGIATTRGSLVKKLHPEYGAGPFGFQEYADYAFVSPDIEVSSFDVPDLPVSDHLPLILTIAG